MGPRTSAARAEVVAAREGLAEEAVRLEASARAAVDIPARIRREPLKMAGAASGAAFLLLGGPGRVVRGIRRAILGPEAELPKSMLPDEVEKTLRKLGPDGDKVRGALERGFASYLEAKAPERRSRDLGATASTLAGSVLGPVTKRVGRQLAEELFSPKTSGASSFEAATRKARARWDEMAAARDGRAPGSPAPAPPTGSPPESAPKAKRGTTAGGPDR